MLERRASTTADLQALREAVRKFVDQEVAPLLVASEQAGAMSPELLDLIKSHGYNGLRISTEWGGQGLSFAEFCVVLEGFARLGPSLHFWIIDSLGMTLQRLGTNEQKDKYLRPYADWTKKGSLGFTEPDAGSDAAAIRTRAVRRDGGWVINGRKHFSSRGDQADFVLITAVTDPERGPRGGITTFLVDRGMPGFTIGRVELSMGSRLHTLAELNFDDCFVPAEAVLGEVGYGFVAAMKTLDDGRLAVSSTCIGTSQRLIELMVDHVKQRSTFGAKLADRQGVRWMIADSRGRAGTWAGTSISLDGAARKRRAARRQRQHLQIALQRDGQPHRRSGSAVARRHGSHTRHYGRATVSRCALPPRGRRHLGGAADVDRAFRSWPAKP